MRLLTLLFLLAAVAASAQKKPAVGPMPDLAALQKMTPAQLEAYKQQMIKQASQQARAISNQYNLKVNEVALPDFRVQMPPKDLPRLALLPAQPPTLIQLADGLRQSKQQLEALVPKAVVEEVAQITAVQTPAQQQSSAVGAFYGDKPAHALLIAMNSALQNLNEAAGLNNLAALFNMTKLEQKAIPILMNLLQKEPLNPMFLNNMGQAYVGLGDLQVGEDFLKRCLEQDELHPEANHTMGMLRLFQNQSEAAMKYFEKELEVAQRGSTLALYKKNGGKIDLYSLRKKRRGVPEKNYFEEVNLGGFVVPAFPTRFEDTHRAKAEGKNFEQSVFEEMMFWQKTATETVLAYKPSDGEKHFGLYHELVKVMLKDLEGLFPPQNLSLFTDADTQTLKDMLAAYNKKMMELPAKYPKEPLEISGPVREAYEKIVCSLQTEIINPFLAEYNGFVSNRIARVQPRWKHYLNGLINIVSLDPSDANKIAVYRSVEMYFGFLGFCWGSGQFIEPPPACAKPSEMTVEEAQALLKSSRSLTLNCPQLFNIEIDLQVAKLKADCSKYGLEIGKGLKAAYEKDFKTGKSTLSAGVGASGKFWHLGKASAKQMLYIAFDDNNQFSDFGLKGTAAVGIGLESEALMVDEIGKIAGTLVGAEAGYTLGVSSGLTIGAKGTGVFQTEKWEKTFK